jgi:ribose transport system ATP-binding protein
MSVPDDAVRTTPLVEVVGAVRRDPGVVVLRGADLTIRAGEVLSLTGENGSGTSTLATIIGGVEQPDEGRILVDGRETVIADPSAARDLGIVMISQELTLAPSLTVAEDIMMGRLPRRGGRVDWSAACRQAGRSWTSSTCTSRSTCRSASSAWSCSRRSRSLARSRPGPGS